jgi:hypothetical protein
MESFNNDALRFAISFHKKLLKKFHMKVNLNMRHLKKFLILFVSLLLITSCDAENIDGNYSSDAGYMLDTEIHHLENGKNLEITFMEFKEGNQWVPSVVLRFGTKKKNEGTLVAITKKTIEQDYLKVVLLEVKDGIQVITKTFASNLPLRKPVSISITACKENYCTISINGEQPQPLPLLSEPHDTTILVSSSSVNIRDSTK